MKRKSAGMLWILAVALGFSLASCRKSDAVEQPSIEFTVLPPAGEGSGLTTDTIEGRVKGFQRGQRIVLFARSGVWWVQPFEARAFTEIQPDSTWKNLTHPGSAYAALLVDERYRPPATIDVLPKKGGSILAVAVVDGNKLAQPARQTVQFSGYEWQIRQTPYDPGGTANMYDPANAEVDADGHLHLHIKRRGDHWTSAELNLKTSLGYGSYRFVVRDVSHLEPAATLALSTWDDYGPNRAMGVEIGRWGEAITKNAQYVVQPYYVPSNVFRFTAPRGRLTFSFRWEPDTVFFSTGRGSQSGADSGGISGHAFTSGIPPSGKETVRMSLYVYQNDHSRLEHDTEVIVEKFEHLP